jgi:hypothetical protein
MAGSTLTCPIGAMAPAAPVTITGSGTLAGSAARCKSPRRVVATAPDPNPGNGSAAVSTTVEGLIDLSITKSVDRPQGFSGTAATFTITVSKLGSSTATSVRDDELPRV